MKQLYVGKKYEIVGPGGFQDVIVDADDGDGWYTVRNLTDEDGPFALNLNLARKVRELDDDWDGNKYADWPK